MRELQEDYHERRAGGPEEGVSLQMAMLKGSRIFGKLHVDLITASDPNHYLWYMRDGTRQGYILHLLIIYPHLDVRVSRTEGLRLEVSVREAQRAYWSAKIFTRYYTFVLARFAVSKFVFWILKWALTQALRGCKALAWFGFYVHFFLAGMHFLIQGWNNALEFLEGFGRAMADAQEEREREAEARNREERARAAFTAYSSGEEQQQKSHKKSKRKR
ncbi:hypothetical protein L218DRAFT_983415 [Marasmius fiardii PR-910]|nr:hypothetical protein L218DRAFT_983415 [Marasmius fiardii PR-910]